MQQNHFILNFNKSILYKNQLNLRVYYYLELTFADCNE